MLIRYATRIEAEDAGATPNGFICAPETEKSTKLVEIPNRQALRVYVKRLRSNCRCDVSTLAESWKILHSCAYMRAGATPSIRQIRALPPVM